MIGLASAFELSMARVSRNVLFVGKFVESTDSALILSVKGVDKPWVKVKLSKKVQGEHTLNDLPANIPTGMTVAISYPRKYFEKCQDKLFRIDYRYLLRPAVGMSAALSDSLEGFVSGDTQVFFNNIEAQFLYLLEDADTAYVMGPYINTKLVLEGLARKRLALITTKQSYSDLQRLYKTLNTAVPSILPSTLARLSYAGAYYSEECKGILHNKVAILYKGDSCLGVWRGSYNFSSHSSMSIEEASFTTNQEISAGYMRRFNQVYAQSVHILQEQDLEDRKEELDDNCGRNRNGKNG